MKIIRNLLAIVGLIALVGAAFGYLTWGSKLAAFDPAFTKTYGEFAERLMETGDPRVALMRSVPVKDDLSPDDAVGAAAGEF